MPSHASFRRRPASCLLAAVAVLAATPAAAEQSAASVAAKGRIAPLNVRVVDATIPADARRAFVGKIEALVDRALGTPALADPRGFSLTRSVAIRSPQEGLPPTHPARGEVVMIIQAIDLEHGAKPDATGAYMGRLEGPSFRFFVNDLMALYANYSGGGDAARDIQYLPLRMSVSQGFPVFQVGPRDVILIGKSDRLPYVHVTKAQYLQAQVDETRATIAQMHGTPHPNILAHLDRLTAELAALGPGDRNARACVSSRVRVTFGDCAAPDATFHVRPNANYFDESAQKGAVQLVAISIPSGRGIGHPLTPRLRAAAAALDYRAIQASLD